MRRVAVEVGRFEAHGLAATGGVHHDGVADELLPARLEDHGELIAASVPRELHHCGGVEVLAAAQRDLVVDVTLAIEDDDAELDAADGEVLPVGGPGEQRRAGPELMRGHLEELLHGDAGVGVVAENVRRDRHPRRGAPASDETDARRSGDVAATRRARPREAPSDEMEVARARVGAPCLGPARRRSRRDPPPRARISGQRVMRPSRVPTAKTRAIITTSLARSSRLVSVSRFFSTTGGGGVALRRSPLGGLRRSLRSFDR